MIENQDTLRCSDVIYTYIWVELEAATELILSSI